MTSTTAAGALADTSALSDFEGLAVRQVGIEIPGAAGGLRDPLRVDPREFHHGEVTQVVLELRNAKTRFEPIDKDDPGGDQRRVHVFEVLSAAFIDRDLVSATLDEQKRRIESAQEAAAGIGHLPFDDEAAKAHADGLHATGLVPGCSACDAELQAMADEESPPPAPTPIAGRAKKAAGK